MTSCTLHVIISSMKVIKQEKEWLKNLQNAARAPDPEGVGVAPQALTIQQDQVVPAYRMMVKHANITQGGCKVQTVHFFVLYCLLSKVQSTK